METKRKSVKFTGGEIQVAEEEIPAVPAGHVLIRSAYSTINPADRAAIMNVKSEGYIYGIDGSGTVQQVGEGVPQELVGKKVAFFQQSWTTHAIRPAPMTVLLDDSQDLKIAATAIVNPLTVCGLLDYCRKNSVKAVIMTAAASQLSKQFFKLTKKDGIEVINIVRKDEQVASLKKDLGANYVLNSEAETFPAEIKTLIDQLKPTAIIECLGGDFSAGLLKLMPHKSNMIVLGNLSLKPLLLDSAIMIYHSKAAIPFFLSTWLFALPKEEQDYWKKLLADDLKAGGPIFGSEVVKVVGLDKWKEAYDECQTVATQGKILISCE